MLLGISRFAWYNLNMEQWDKKDKIQLIIKNFADGILVFDEEDKLTLINPQAEEFLRVQGEEAVGKTFLELKDLANLRPVTGLFDYKKVWGVFKKEVFEEGETNLIFEVSFIPLFESEKKLGTLVILHDVTREKRIEKMKTDFISLAAHQLRTPLSAIKWALETVLEGDVGRLNQEQKELLKRTHQSNERMIRLIKDLLDVAKIEEGKYIFSYSLESLEIMTQEAIDSLQEVIKSKNLKFDFKKPIDGKLPRVKVDREKIELAIENLIENALKYTPPGGEVTVSLKCDKLEVEFKVQDSGIGISKNQQERVFSKFFRTSQATQMETDGSGLGLYLTKNIIEAHGGKIGFVSAEGKGSSFWFTLPLKEEFEENLERF